MADGLREDGETSLESLLVSRSVVPPGSPIKFTKSGKTVRIPVTRIRCGKWDFRAEERWLEYQPTSTGIVVVFRDRQHFDHEECVMFNLLDISAADLRVTAKFGSLDAMSAILTLECGKAIQITGSDHNLECTTHVMEITFHVNYTGQVRDVLRSLRQAKLCEDTPATAPSGSDVEQFSETFREGLPDWVLYIPRRLYTPSSRRAVETILTFYTIFSILWALWQLYRHVDFIRAYVRPVIDALISHIRTLDKLIQVANTLLEKFTQQWLSYFKPVCVIITSFATPLISLGKHFLTAFLSVYSVIKVVFQPFVSVFQPLFNALFTVIKVPASIFRQIYDVFHSVGIVVYESLYSTQAAQLLRNCSQTMGEIIERSMRLDPLKAQLILMRSNVLNSGKALCHGFVYIYKSVERRVWYVFWRTTEEKED
ncbi:uncharacterized protein LOC110236677 [Exaiptasia diaphana]|uniref:Uncharacterized protein n=1 Tax=Exaiptasia diaphana TaxID=2652724 RepID=A0A913X366_EXADI|nr:uncharacterized protein LOC110236677 [Exaiptasia diaphana]